MFWGIAIIAGFVVVGWIIFGNIFPASGSNGAKPNGPGCGDCTGLDRWWAGLSTGQKWAMAASMAAKKASCSVRNCSTA
jgi:hypothetical protein